LGGGTVGDRTRALRIARGEAEETIKHLRSNFHAQRIMAREYWTLHNLMVVIVKMLDSLIDRR
jgi:four helix bundle protein